MKFQQIWESIVRKRPEASNPDAKIEITSRNLRLLLEQVYDKGLASGRDQPKGDASLGDFFESIGKAAAGRKR